MRNWIAIITCFAEIYRNLQKGQIQGETLPKFELFAYITVKINFYRFTGHSYFSFSHFCLSVKVFITFSRI